MKVNSSRSTVGVADAPSNNDTIAQSLDQLERLTQAFQQQPPTAEPSADSNRLVQGVNNTLQALDGPGPCSEESSAPTRRHACRPAWVR
jgi:hypothetical protein